VQAPPLVLFHGGLSNSLMWLRSIRSWSEHFRVYCVDTIGDPGFSAPSRPSFSTDEHTRWLDDVWRELSLVCPDVVGWSLGGWLGLDYAMRRPSSVRSLVLLSPGGIVPMRPSMFFTVIPLLMMGPWGRRKAFHVSMGSRDEGQEGADSAFVNFSLLAQKHMLGRTRLPTVFTDTMLRSLRIPLTVFIGEHDIFFDARKMRNRLATCLPGATVHWLPGVGHGLLDPTRRVLDSIDSQRAPAPR
jgi:pimeloyl-ACP methyl ester carboxylesterase